MNKKRKRLLSVSSTSSPDLTANSDKESISSKSDEEYMSSLSDKEDGQPNMKKSKTKKTYEVSFRAAWLDQFGDWLCEDKSIKHGKKCKFCLKSIAGGRAHLLRHSKNMCHVNNMEAAATNSNLESVNASNVFSKKERVKKFKERPGVKNAIAVINQDGDCENMKLNLKNNYSTRNDKESAEEENVENSHKSTKKKVYKVGFYWPWLNEFGEWLCRDGLTEDGKKCKFCNTSIQGGHAHLLRHSKSGKHIKMIKKFSTIQIKESRETSNSAHNEDCLDEDFKDMKERWTSTRLDEIEQDAPNKAAEEQIIENYHQDSIKSKRKCEKNKIAFREAWLIEFGDWLCRDELSEYGKLCIFCQESVDGGRTQLLRHSKSATHVEKMKSGIENEMERKESPDVSTSMNHKDAVDDYDDDDLIISDVERNQLDPLYVKPAKNVPVLYQRKKISEVTFCASWITEFGDWLCEDNSIKNGKKCKVCHTYIAGGRNHLHRHSLSASHIAKMKDSAYQPVDVPFRLTWINEFGDWLVRDNSIENGKKCKYCLRFVYGGRFQIKRHSRNPSHLARIIGSTLTRDSRAVQRAKALEKSLALLIAEHNAPFSLLDHLGVLLKNKIPDSKTIREFSIDSKKGRKLISEITGSSMENLSFL